MSNHRRQCKRRVHEFAQSIQETGADRFADVLEEYYHPDANWQGPAPIDELNGRAEIHDGYWEPLLESFPDLE